MSNLGKQDGKFFGKPDRPDQQVERPSDALLNDPALSASRRRRTSTPQPLSGQEERSPNTSGDPSQLSGQALLAQVLAADKITQPSRPTALASRDTLQILVNPAMKKSVVAMAKGTNRTVSAWMNLWLRMLTTTVLDDPSVVPADLRVVTRSTQKRWTVPIQILVDAEVSTSLQQAIAQNGITSHSRFIRWGLVTYSESLVVEPNSTEY